MFLAAARDAEADERKRAKMAREKVDEAALWAKRVYIVIDGPGTLLHLVACGGGR